MDIYLFEQFFVELDDVVIDGFFNFVLSNAQDKVEFKNKGYYTYYPQEKRAIQLVLDTTRTGNNINIDNFFFHHTSNNIWKLKVIQKLDGFPCSYMVSNTNGDGFLCTRIINEAVLGKTLKENDTFEAQVVGLVTTGHIYQSEKEYIDSVLPNENGEKYLMEDGGLIPINMIVNNNMNLSEEERETNDHLKDMLLSFKGKIKYARGHRLHMFDIDLPDYYSVSIDTEYGELDIFFNRDVLNPEMKGFGEGNIIVGELLLSGDVCINKYDKYIKNTDLKTE